MNLAIVRHSVRNRGSDNAFFNYARYLIQQGDRVFYYTNHLETGLEYHSGIRFQPIPWAGTLGTVLFVLFKRFPEDIVAVDHILLAPVAWMRNRKKLVYLARGYDVSYFRSPVIRRVIKFLFRLALENMKIPVISVSDSLTKTLMQFSPHRIVTSPNGVDTQLFTRDPDQKSFVKNTGEFVILFHYRDEYVKGSDIGLKAFRHLAGLKKDAWTLWVIGETLPPQEGYRVVNHGFLSHQKLKDILSATDIFFLPSRSEGQSPLLLQALSCECAVVATTASSILTQETTALVAPVEDWETSALYLKRLIEDSGLRSRLQKNARPLAEQFSMEKSCESFKQALSTIACQR